MSYIETKTRPHSPVLKPYEMLTEDAYRPQTHNAFLDTFKAICADPALRAVSFDCFDTLLWRKFRDPVDVFWGLGARLIDEGILTPDFTPSKFKRARIEAERIARERRVRGGHFHEVTIEEIYAEFAALSPEDQTRAVAAEVAEEAACTIADPFMAEALETAIEMGKEVMIISNTYLSVDQLSALLKGKSVDRFARENIHVSCAHRRDKETGLVSLILSERGLRPAEVLHIGDNQWGDVAVPQQTGTKTLFYPKFSDIHGDIVERETKVRAFAVSDEAPKIDILPQLRRMRLAAEGHTRQTSVAEQIGAFIVGPALAAYADWLLDMQSDQADAPVLCLTREGLFLSEVFQMAARARGREGFISLPFLSSRSIVFGGSFFEFSIDELETFLLSRRTPFTLRTFAQMVECEEISATDMGCEEADLDAPLIHGAPLTNTLIASMTRHDGLKAASLAYSAARRADFKRYIDASFKRHGVRDDVQTIYVADVGWSGRSQRLMERVLHACGRRVQVRGLYMATDHGSFIEHMLGLKAQGWLYDGGTPERDALLGLQSKEIIEQVCSSSLGAVRGYDAAGDPIFGTESKGLVQRVDLTRLRNAARSTIEMQGTFRAMLDGTGLEHHLTDPTSHRTSYAGLITFAREAEYEMFSSWTHEENNLSDNVETLSSDYWKTFAAYATPQQFLEAHSYWKLPEFQRTRPALADSLLLKTAGLASFAQEDEVAFDVTISHEGDAVCETRNAYVSLDGRALLAATRVCDSGTSFDFRNTCGRPVEIDAVLIAAYDTADRSRIERALLPDFAEHPEIATPTRTLAPGEHFRVTFRAGARRAAPVSIVLCLQFPAA